MSKKINWGVLATGNIATKMAVDLNYDPGSNLIAVASRTSKKAEAFAKKHRIQKFYGSYSELMKDPEIDVVYIGTPNTTHHPLIIESLENGKNVLCEKPFTLNASEAKACIQLAQTKRLFLMEAMWTRFFPVIQKIQDLLAQNKIGVPDFCRGNFHVKFEYNPEHRVFNPDLGGGALLDIGIYLISLSNYFLGIPLHVNGHCQKTDQNVDRLNTVFLTYPNNKNASLASGFNSQLPRTFYISGSLGYIKIHDIFFKPGKFSLHLGDQAPQTFLLPFESNGYVHMVRHVNTCLRQGLVESPVMPLTDTLTVLKNMDTLRKSWNVVYPQEQ